jgi:hypothetical protein
MVAAAALEGTTVGGASGVLDEGKVVGVAVTTSLHAAMDTDAARMPAIVAAPRRLTGQYVTFIAVLPSAFDLTSRLGRGDLQSESNPYDCT